MTVVQHNGKEFDLSVVQEAVEAAFAKQQAEDEAYCYRNLAVSVEYSPLTNKLAHAYSVLVELRLATNPNAQVIPVRTAVDDSSALGT